MATENRSKVIAIVGAKRMGKSTLVNSIIGERKDAIIYDPESEYERGIYCEIDVFKEIVNNSVNCLVVWEEASSFFGSKRDLEMRAMLSRNRHKNVDHLLIFHSLNDLPRYILDRLDYIYLFHTKDTPVSVKQKFSGRSDILAAFEKAQKYTAGKYETVIY